MPQNWAHTTRSRLNPIGFDSSLANDQACSPQIGELDQSWPAIGKRRLVSQGIPRSQPTCIPRAPSRSAAAPPTSRAGAERRARVRMPHGTCYSHYLSSRRFPCTHQPRFPLRAQCIHSDPFGCFDFQIGRLSKCKGKSNQGRGSAKAACKTDSPSSAKR